MSRSVVIMDDWPGTPTDEQKRLYEHALKQVMNNTEIIQAGLSHHEFNDKSWCMPERFWANRYGVAVHDVGLCEEYPAIPTHVDMDQGEGYEGEFQPSDVLCVESSTGLEGGREYVKLEIQVLATENGVERLDEFPFEER